MRCAVPVAERSVRRRKTNGQGASLATFAASFASLQTRTAQRSVPTTPARSSSLVDTRVIYCGDCLEQLRKLPDACVDLIYIHPPFNSNRNYEDKVGRPDIDAFETAMRRSKREKGFFIAFDYTEDALREIDRFFKADHAVIVPLTVQEILDEQIARKLV